MRIITLNKQNNYRTEGFYSIMDEANKNLCIDYSEKPAMLMLLLAKLDISVKFTGIKEYFNDKKERLTGQFRIIRDNEVIIFDFGFSLNDTKTFNSAYKDRQKFFNSLLYNCLCSCKSDYYISIDFEEFCSEFGYNSDSIKDKNLWERCLKQSHKLQKIFSDNEIECLPS
jgi:hypothetical protein